MYLHLLVRQCLRLCLRLRVRLHQRLRLRLDLRLRRGLRLRRLDLRVAPESRRDQDLRVCIRSVLTPVPSLNHRPAQKLCQRCLQAGHFTFECKNEPKYVSRPSRTAQIANPALKPALRNVAPAGEGEEDITKK